MPYCRCIFPVLLCLFGFRAIHSQPALKVQVLDKPIIVDGTINQEEWQPADSVSGFHQLEPERGAASTRETIVFSGQYGKDLYFAFICRLGQPEEAVARVQRRDQLNPSDDIISILLDTYHDKRTALLFLVNPIGTLTDAKVTDDGKILDLLWDTEWEAQTSRGEKYWMAEIRIPFESIQYKPESEVWGVNFGRVIRANQETSWWAPVSENFRVSQGGVLTGIRPKGKPRHILRLFPYGTLRYEDSDITGVHNKVKGDGGLDLQYLYGSNVVANLTAKPDFATVEGDKEQVNLTPWELLFPDKRLFFQDGNEMFQTRISTFYSRRIGDMAFGGKVIGKTGKYQFNALFARTEENREGKLPEAFHNAVRIKRDILRSSIVGLTYADKITDTSYIRSLSADYVLNLGKTWKLTGQFVGSAPGSLLNHAAWFVRFARENNVYHYHLRYSSLGRNFRDNVNQTGFIPDDDRHELDSDVSYRFWINEGVKYIFLEGKNNVFWSQSGALRSWYLTYRARMYLSNRFSLEAAYNDEFKLLDKDYYNHFYKADVGYNTDEASYVQLGYQAGRNFGRDFQLWRLFLRFQLFSRLALSYELTRLDYEPDPSSSSTAINVLGADFFFNKDLWIRVFTQNNSVSDKFYFYGLFGWRFKPPFGAVYLIVSADKFRASLQPENIRSEIVFLKFTYPISIL